MKGPGQRIRYDVRRVWKCPQCGATAKTGPQQIALQCVMHDRPVWMKLLEPPLPELPPIEPLPPEQVAPQAARNKAGKRRRKKTPQAASTTNDAPQNTADRDIANAAAPETDPS
ncbi:MAG: hypothetical protein D6725_08240 [Planctomycetota bacterium]|nr:MAG: hypothetical protein D6725_08240 [Planctomycetota bacterium]